MRGALTTNPRSAAWFQLEVVQHGLRCLPVDWVGAGERGPMSARGIATLDADPSVSGDTASRASAEEP